MLGCFGNFPGLVQRERIFESRVECVGLFYVLHRRILGLKGVWVCVGGQFGVFPFRSLMRLGVETPEEHELNGLGG